MATISSILGGIGLFILGMLMMTDSLKAIAGDALKRLLSKFTGGTFKAILSGAGITALIQSSSATTLMTIGFVSAGLLTFTQSIGVIIGANLGSTSTGWIVSLIGLKISMNALALPIIGIGILLRMFSKGRYAAHGLALTGFGLLFLGIDVLQQGMLSLTEIIDLSAFSQQSIFNLLLLVLIGILMTVIMQSSSAAVVTTLAALNTGVIGFDQAAALVIGQNVGTTVKAVLASIGASVPAKRTSLAHIFFNVGTGIVALLTLPLLSQAVFLIGDLFAVTDAAVLIAIFHTLFNIVGLLIFVPFIKRFAGIIERIVPEQDNHLIRHLDSSVALVAPVAIEATRRTLVDITLVVSQYIKSIFEQQNHLGNDSDQLKEAETAIQKVREFLSKINTETASSRKDYINHLSSVHALDHLDRLIRASKEREYIKTVFTHQELGKARKLLEQSVGEVAQRLDQNGEVKQELVVHVEAMSLQIADIRREDRRLLLETSIKSPKYIQDTLEKVHTLLWLDRLAYHLWRTVYHLSEQEHSPYAIHELGQDDYKHRS